MSNNEEYIEEPSNITKIVNLFKRSEKIIIDQENTIKDLQEIITIKDKTIGKQLLMLQMMELKLREFGINFGEESIF